MQSFEFRVFNTLQNVTIDVVYTTGGLLNQIEMIGGSAKIILPGRNIGTDNGQKSNRLIGDSASSYIPISGWFKVNPVPPQKRAFMVSLTKVSDKSPMEVCIYSI